MSEDTKKSIAEKIVRNNPKLRDIQMSRIEDVVQSLMEVGLDREKIVEKAPKALFMRKAVDNIIQSEPISIQLQGKEDGEQIDAKIRDDELKQIIREPR